MITMLRDKIDERYHSVTEQQIDRYLELHGLGQNDRAFAREVLGSKKTLIYRMAEGACGWFVSPKSSARSLMDDADGLSNASMGLIVIFALAFFISLLIPALNVDHAVKVAATLPMVLSAGGMFFMIIRLLKKTA